MQRAMIISTLFAVLCQEAFSIEVDFSRSGMQLISRDTIKIRNVRVNGKNYYGIFKWQDSGLKLVSAGEDRIPILSVTGRRFSIDDGVEVNLTQGCIQEFSSYSRVADFQDLIALTSDNNSLESLLFMIDGEGKILLSYGGLTRKDGSNPYFITTDYVEPDEAERITTLRGVIGMYAAFGNIEGKILCINVKPESNPFF